MFPFRRTYRFPNRRDQTIPLKTRAHPFETDAPFVCALSAPAWGATIPPPQYISMSSYFNPRSRVGSDRSELARLREDNEFQSTLPRGERLVFNQHRDLQRNISIHAPAWGATWCTDHRHARWSISIHAPAWGATAKINKASCSKINTRSDIAIPLPKSGENKPFSPLFFYFDPHSRREGSGKILDTSPSRRITFIPGRVHPIKQ